MNIVAKPSLRAMTVGTVLMVAAFAVAMAPSDPSPLSVSTGLFELGGVQTADIRGDGNPLTGPDWAPFDDTTNMDGLFRGDGSIIDLYGGIAASFVADDLAQKSAVDKTTFSGAGGSNKNNDPITDWHWDSGNVPPKDDFANTYAYATTAMVVGEPHLIIYSGFERIAENGDSHIDIEFFQDLVSLDEEPPCNDPGPDPTPCDFVGTRTVGDIIISMDFLNGGAFGTMSIREWDGTEYVLVATLVGEGCILGDAVCGYNNGLEIDGGPWPNYDRHGKEIEMLPQNAFTELGVDVTALLGETPCISTIMGKTRSSQSFTAELKDFAGPSPFTVCGASIQIDPPLATNEVGDTHTFTVTVSKVIAGRSEPADDGTIVTVTLTPSNGAVLSDVVDDCASPGTIGGVCTVSFTSYSGGLVTGHAEADVEIGGLLTVHVETDGIPPNSGDAEKYFVDAFITINPPLDTNSIQETHTFTVEVQVDDGTGAGFQPVEDGTTVTVTLTSSAGALATDIVDNCASPGTVGGVCTVSFTSNTAGTVTGHASVTLTVGGILITRETDGSGSNSGDAIKHFVAGTLRWTKVDNAGRLQSGATFEVCRTHDYDSETYLMVDISDVCVTVLDNSPPDEDTDGGEFLLTGLRLGRYTIDETVAPPGYAEDPKVETVDLTLAIPDGEAYSAFVNQRPIIKITAFGYTNEPAGTPTDGVVSGTTVFTFKVKNFGGASATLDGGLVVTFSSSSSYFVCDGPGGSCEVDLTGISLAPGAEMTFTLTVTYTDAPDGTEVYGSLDVTYTLNGLTRTASGSPAEIMFTIQGD